MSFNYVSPAPAEQNGGGTTIVASVPTGGDAPVEGEQVYIFVYQSRGTNPVASFTTPAGWTLVDSERENFIHATALYTKIAGASESDVSITSDTTVTGNDYAYAVYIRMTGVHDAAASILEEGVGTTFDSPAIIPSEDGATIVSIIAWNVATPQTTTIPSELDTKELEVSDGFNTQIVVASGDQVTAANTTPMSWAGLEDSQWVSAYSFSVVPASGDVTAPVLSSPSASDLQETTVDLGVTTDEDNGTLYWYISASATPPSEADLKAGTGAVASGSQAVSAAGAQAVNNAGTLVGATSYYAHLLHSDAAVNDSNIVTTAQFTTATPDTTAPTFGSAPAADTIGSTTVTLAATASDAVDSSVDHYVVIVADGATAPSGTQVAAGQDSTGSAAIASGNDTGVNNGVEASIALTGLSASTPYDAYWVAQDSVPNRTSPQLVNFTTLAAANAGLRIPVKNTAGADYPDTTDITVLVYDAVGGTESLQTTGAISSGVLTIDSDSVGSVGATVFVVGHKDGASDALDIGFSGEITVVDLNTSDNSV